MTNQSELIERLHHSGCRMVVVVTGGGSRIIGDLLSVPGGSLSVLEARVPYLPAALHEWLGRTPDSYCARDTALGMASVAWRRARQLNDKARLTAQSGSSGAGSEPEVPDRCVGLSCTASLASAQPKRGEHRCWIAVQTDSETRLVTLTFHKGRRTRAEEEAVVADLMLTALAAALELEPAGTASLLTEGEQPVFDRAGGSPELQEVRLGQRSLVWSLPDGTLVAERASVSNESAQPRAVVSGSFSPLHRGHIQLRHIAEQRVGGPVVFELPVLNADKPPLDYFAIAERRRQFVTDPLALTSAPLFEHKAALFPSAVFVIGFDTAERILQPRFYGGGEAGVRASLNQVRAHGCRFLVAGRQGLERFQTLADLRIPTGFEALFEGLTEAEFRDDISSTELRRLG